MANLNAFRRNIAVARGIDPVSVIPEDQRHALSVKDVLIGGVIRLSGEVFVVKGTATYTETKNSYKAMPKGKAYVATELVLFSLKTGETRYIEWGIDDELEVSFTERKIARSELGRSLTYDDGEVVDLDDADEIVDKEWELVFKGRTYHYADDWPCRYKSSDGRDFFAYMYEFEADNGHQLTIEGWSSTGSEEDDWEYEVYLSHNVDPASVEVISTGALAEAA